MNIFFELTAIVLLATILAIILRVLRQPLLIAYIITGILISPLFLNIMHSKEYIQLFSQIGITILLFIVGLNLSPKVIKEVGKVSLFGGLGQIVFTALLGYIISVFCGFTAVQSFYIGAAVSFSSTIIILKILTDKGDLPRLYAKVTIGILLLQDITAIAVLLFMSSFHNAASPNVFLMVMMIVGKAIAVFAVLYFVTKYILSRSIHFFASSQELIFLFSISWGLGLACIFYLFGFSIEVGALMAGITISVTSYADGIASKLKPLRDFFIILFFILLGSNMELSSLRVILVPAVILSLFVLIGKPLLVFILMNILGYKTRPAFQTATTLGQVSEFSLILITLGVTNGQIGNEIVSLMTFVTIVSIAGSSYAMQYEAILFSKLGSLLKTLELRNNKRQAVSDDDPHDLILFGFDRVGKHFVHAFAKLDKKYVVIDFNPELINQMKEENIPFKYGDVEDSEFLQELNLKHLKLCVSTIPNVKINSLLIQKIRSENAKAIIIVRARETEDAQKFYELGASYVVMPHYLGAQYATKMIERIGLDPKGFAEEREKHLRHVTK